LSAPSPDFSVRLGDAGDVQLVLSFFDAAVRWLVARGNTAQWGTEPFSTNPPRIAAAEAWAASGGLRIAERDGVGVGALVIGDAPEWAPPAVEPELYVISLVTSRAPEARGAGRFLLGVAEDEARDRGVPMLRVDCFAGGDRALVKVYESAGFTPTVTFMVGDWPGQVLEKRLPPMQAA
jgi:GNAT superfamily N-acetyltransferase